MEEEEEERKAREDESLDTPEDDRGAARCREYAPRGIQGPRLVTRLSWRWTAGRTCAAPCSTASATARAGKTKDHVAARGRLGCSASRATSGAGCRSRRLEEFSRADAGEWTCSVSSHPRINSCDVPQELEDDDIDARIAMGDQCPFYDDNDLNPPEIIAEEEEPAAEDDEEERGGGGQRRVLLRG